LPVHVRDPAPLVHHHDPVGRGIEGGPEELLALAQGLLGLLPSRDVPEKSGHAAGACLEGKDLEGTGNVLTLVSDHILYPAPAGEGEPAVAVRPIRALQHGECFLDLQTREGRMIKVQYTVCRGVCTREYRLSFSIDLIAVG